MRICVEHRIVLMITAAVLRSKCYIFQVKFDKEVGITLWSELALGSADLLSIHGVWFHISMMKVFSSVGVFEGSQ